MDGVNNSRLSLRKCKAFKNERKTDPETRRVYYEKSLDFTGIFHQWGTSFAEYDAGPGNFTVAIVEKDDGTIETVDANYIQFQEPLMEEGKGTLMREPLIKGREFYEA